VRPAEDEEEEAGDDETCEITAKLWFGFALVLSVREQ
jgi:hypothetical protein